MGWKPVELFAQRESALPTTIVLGPGIQQAIAEGKINRAELVKQYEEMGIKVVDK
jgi:hypothetical protein